MNDHEREAATLARGSHARRASDAAGIGVLEVDAGGRILHVNDEVGEILGYDGRELVGMTIGALTAPEDRERSRDLNAQLGATLDGFDYEKRYLRKDGRRVWVHVTVSVLRDAAGAFQRAIGTVQEISARARSGERAPKRNSRRDDDPRFRALFEHAAIGMGIVRFDDARWLDVNAAFCCMLGRTREEMLRTPWPEVTYPEDLELDLKPFRSMSKGELESYTVEKRFLHKDGHHVWARLTLSLVRDEEGRPDYEIAIIEDIGARKAAEKALREAQAQREAERARLEAILVTLPVGFVVLDEHGVMTLANSVMKRTWGRDFALPCAIDYESYRGFWPDTGERLRREDWPSARALRGERVEDVMIDVERSDGSRGTIIAASAPIRDESGRVVGAVVANQDISELRAMQARVEEADRRKGEFLAVLSHELRNPLTPIRNSIHILEKALPGGDQAKRALQVIERQVTQMTHLIDDLLDVTRISRGKVRLQTENLDLREIAKATADDLQGLFQRSGVDFDLQLPDDPVRAKVDRTRIAQIIGNLLQNAVKFTPAGGKVTLTLDTAEDRAILRVRDTGVGIEPELQSELFEPFVQADKTLHRTQGGLGLGLALVKGLVELHGGTVRAKSEGSGKGAELTIELPTEDHPTPKPRTIEPPEPPEHPMKVLLIEDNLDAAESLKEVLELDGHEVETAATGLAGLEKAQHFHPEVVLCDLGLPGIDGFEVARRIRQDPTLEKTCLVALSGYAAPEDQEKSKEAGFTTHLAKPPDLQVLEATLKSCARR